jgi:hypothetical protein
VPVPPAHFTVPARTGTYGPEVADWADDCGFTLDLEQRLLLDGMYAHGPRGELVATEACVVMARQCGKTQTLLAAALADLFMFDEPGCLWTAHMRSALVDQNSGAFVLCKRVIDSYDHLRRYVRRFSEADGEEGVELLSGASLAFRTRSARSGRALTGRRITLDEALYLDAATLGALVPVLSAQSMRADVQLRYGSSAGKAESAVLRGVRDRGRAGTSPRLFYAEWTAPRRDCAAGDCVHEQGAVGCALDDVELLRQANPALERRIALDFVLGTERASLTPLEFMRERLAWWEDPAVGAAAVLPAWPERVDIQAKPVRPLVVGVDQGEDRMVSIGCAWFRADGAVQVMASQGDTVDVGLSAAQAVERLAELRARWGVTVMLGGPAAGLEDDLRAAGVRVAMVTSAEFATACGQIADRVADGTLRHGNQGALNTAVQGARWRPVGTAGERAWQLKDSPGIGPLAAVTRAVAGLRRAAPSSGPVAITTSSTAFDVAGMEF